MPARAGLPKWLNKRFHWDDCQECSVLGAPQTLSQCGSPSKHSPLEPRTQNQPRKPTKEPTAGTALAPNTTELSHTKRNTESRPSSSTPTKTTPPKQAACSGGATTSCSRPCRCHRLPRDDSRPWKHLSTGTYPPKRSMAVYGAVSYRTAEHPTRAPVPCSSTHRAGSLQGSWLRKAHLVASAASIQEERLKPVVGFPDNSSYRGAIMSSGTSAFVGMIARNAPNTRKNL